MEYFSPTKLRGIKNISQNKTKQISKRGKDRVWGGLERGFGGFRLEEFFCWKMIFGI